MLFHLKSAKSKMIVKSNAVYVSIVLVQTHYVGTVKDVIVLMYVIAFYMLCVQKQKNDHIYAAQNVRKENNVLILNAIIRQSMLICLIEKD